MRKLIFTILSIVIGSGLWWALSNSKKISVKKWDTKFDSLMRHSLYDVGIKDDDIVSSINEVKKESGGEWVQHIWTVKDLSKDQKKKLRKMFEDAGAHVEERRVDNKPRFYVKRDNRIYQEIRFASPQ